MSEAMQLMSTRLYVTLGFDSRTVCMVALQTVTINVLPHIGLKEISESIL